MGIVLDEIEFKTPGSPLLMLGFLSFLKGPLLNEKVITCLRLMVKILRDTPSHLAVSSSSVSDVLGSCGFRKRN